MFKIQSVLQLRCIDDFPLQYLEEMPLTLNTEYTEFPSEHPLFNFFNSILTHTGFITLFRANISYYIQSL